MGTPVFVNDLGPNLKVVVGVAENRDEATGCISMHFMPDRGEMKVQDSAINPALVIESVKFYICGMP